MTFRHASARQVRWRPLLALGVALGVLFGLGPVSGSLAAVPSTSGSLGLPDAARIAGHRIAGHRFGTALLQPVVLAHSLARLTGSVAGSRLPRHEAPAGLLPAAASPFLGGWLFAAGFRGRLRGDRRYRRTSRGPPVGG